MDLHNQARPLDGEITGIGTLLGMVAAAMVVLGIIITVFGEDQSSEPVSAAYSVPSMTERMKRNRSAEPRTVGSIAPAKHTIGAE